jgi:hypothetical protein
VVDVGVDRIAYNEDGSITQITIGNVQSIQLAGRSRVYSNVGRTVIQITFPDPESHPVFEVIRQSGQHSEISQEDVICDALAP